MAELQIQPRSRFSITRTLFDPFDDTTYFIQGKIYKVNLDDTADANGSQELIDTVTLIDQGDGKRFLFVWTVIPNNTIDGINIQIVTNVFTNAGFTTKSENHQTEERNYIVLERTAGRKMGGIDFRKVKSTTEEVFKEKFDKRFDKRLEEILSRVVDKAVGNIEFKPEITVEPTPVTVEPTAVTVEAPIVNVKPTSVTVQPTPVTVEPTPVTINLDENTQKIKEFINKSFIGLKSKSKAINKEELEKVLENNNIDLLNDIEEDLEKLRK